MLSQDLVKLFIYNVLHRRVYRCVMIWVFNQDHSGLSPTVLNWLRWITVIERGERVRRADLSHPFILLCAIWQQYTVFVYIICRVHHLTLFNHWVFQCWCLIWSWAIVSCLIHLYLMETLSCDEMFLFVRSCVLQHSCLNIRVFNCMVFQFLHQACYELFLWFHIWLWFHCTTFPDCFLDNFFSRGPSKNRLLESWWILNASYFFHISFLHVIREVVLKWHLKDKRLFWSVSWWSLISFTIWTLKGIITWALWTLKSSHHVLFL